MLCFALFVVTPVLILTTETSRGGSATWDLNPTNGDWNTAANWTPDTVPNGPADTATFDFSNITGVSLSVSTEVNSIMFDAGASAFTSTVPASVTLTISGLGITNNSGVGQNFVTAVDEVGGAGVIQFTQSATAGSLTQFTNEGGTDGGGGGVTSFASNANAGAGTFVNNGSVSSSALGGRTEFFNNSSASSGTFITNGGAAFFANGGRTQFFHNSTAGDGTFTVNGGGVSGAFGGLIEFYDGSNSGNGNFTINGPEATDAFGGGIIYFYDTASAGNGTFTVNDGGLLIFSAASASTAGNAALIANGGPSGGATILFTGASTGGTARVQVFKNGELDISFHSLPGVTVGSIEGTGNVLLGAHNLTVGTNNLSTTFAGIIFASRSGGSFTKVGTGTLVLTNANTYRGGTEINGGTLLVENTTGSGTGQNGVRVNIGTLGGSGRIGGAVAVGTGNGPGAFLSPGSAVDPGTLSIHRTLTFNADATYNFELNSSSTAADQVIVKGVTINNGALFSFSDLGNGTLAPGTVLTIIDNKAPTPIVGTFSNLSDDSTFSIGNNTFRVDYQGGDGNDLTLTIHPLEH